MTKHNPMVLQPLKISHGTPDLTRNRLFTSFRHLTCYQLPSQKLLQVISTVLEGVPLLCFVHILRCEHCRGSFIKLKEAEYFRNSLRQSRRTFSGSLRKLFNSVSLSTFISIYIMYMYMYTCIHIRIEYIYI